MASTKNVHALNSRLDMACRSRIEEFYRQHVSSLAHLEHQRLETARLLMSVKKCPSDHEALSVKFLGPAPKSGHYRHGRQQAEDPVAAPDRKPCYPKSGSQSARASPIPTMQAESAAGVKEQTNQYRRQQTANPFAVVSSDSAAAVARIERAKTFATDVAKANEKSANDANFSRHSQRRRRSQRQRRRARTPLPSKLERFYSHLEDTKRGCGLPVIDATQTSEAHQFYLTLSRAEWRARLAKIDPEYFKNAHLHNDSDSDAESVK